MVVLGQQASDSISGFTGIAIARTEYLHGCIRVQLQSKAMKDGIPMEGLWFDEAQLSGVTSPGTGGPSRSVPPNRDP